MSIKLLSAAWDLPIGSTEKMVLMSLCDFANEQGTCWPSIATICRKTSKSERTVQTALKWLRDNGYYEVNGYHKQTPLYELNPRKICTPAEIAPPQKLHATPAKSAPKPLRTTNVVKDKSLTNIRAKPFAKPEGVEQSIWSDFLDLRKAKRAPLSNTALAAIEREAGLVGWTLNQAITEMVARGWQGFKANWVKEKSNDRSSNPMGATERAARQALHEISGGIGRFDGSGAEVASGDFAGGNRTIDAVPSPNRAIGYAGG